MILEGHFYVKPSELGHVSGNAGWLSTAGTGNKESMRAGREIRGVITNTTGY
jgi:hypothetical protein